ncbi:hypothetical protein [Streptomyces sp. NPDC093225]|uniref:hypothetical protein n=1 Tax=Streptomyces sp. NPDC093225 TaxID=3366034 RepID=UPI003804D528
MDEFRTYLRQNGSDDGLEAAVVDVKIERIGLDGKAVTDAVVITGLDPDLETSGSPDDDKARALAQAFADWRTSAFHERGSVRVLNPALETMTALKW